MSHRQLQRVVVRMLYDPAFAARVFADPATVLCDEDLTDEERHWLVNADPRAYAVDQLRRTRLLVTLVEEFPVSVQHVVLQSTQPALLEQFFSSAAFHACIQQRGSLAGAFGAYLNAAEVRQYCPQLDIAPFVHIELAIARLRRRVEAPDTVRPQGATELALAPTVALLASPVGMLEHYRATLALLSQDAAGLVAAALTPAPLTLPQPTTAQEWLLLVWHDAQETAAIEVLPEALGTLLATAPAQRAALVHTACTLGAESQEAQEILDDLIADGVLCAGEGA